MTRLVYVGDYEEKARTVSYKVQALTVVIT